MDTNVTMADNRKTYEIFCVEHHVHITYCLHENEPKNMHYHSNVCEMHQYNSIKICMSMNIRMSVLPAKESEEYSSVLLKETTLKYV